MLAAMTTPAAPPPLFALDFETTGLSPRADRVLEVGLAGPRPYQALVRDAGPASAAALAVHGITEAEARAGGVPGRAALAGLLDALGPGPVRIAAHSAGFERGFLEAWAGRNGWSLPEIQWVCTLDLARGQCAYPGISRRLEALAWRFGLEHGPLHRAPADAALTLRLLGQLEAWGAVAAALGGRQALVYLAGPVRGDGTRAAIRRNLEHMLRLAQWAQGTLPDAALFVPHGNFAFMDESGPGPWVRDRAMAGCERVLSRCDALVLCAREPSPGMVREWALARELGLPVFQVPGWDRPVLADAADGAA